MNKNQLLEIKEIIKNAKKDFKEINKNHDCKGYDFDNQVDILEYWFDELDNLKFELSFYNKNDKTYKNVIQLMKDIKQLLNEMI